MDATRRAALCVVLLALASAGTAAPEPDSAAPPAARVADLEWLAGAWRGEEEGALSEETWARPEGDTMIGMWRLVADGRARVIEILVIRGDEKGVTLFLRHFDAQLVAREEKDKPLALPLVASGPRRAEFEGEAVAAYGGLVRIAYERTSDDTLVSTLERAGKRQTFRFTRRR